MAHAHFLYSFHYSPHCQYLLPFLPILLFVESDRDKNKNKAFSLCFSHISALSKTVLLGVNCNAFRHQ